LQRFAQDEEKFVKVLVTGGNGFIGSAVCRHCINDLGWQVVNVDALTYAATTGSLEAVQNHSNYKFYHANILDRASISGILAQEKPDAVMHLAAESHVDRSIDGPMAFVETNVLGTVALLEAVRGHVSNLSPEQASKFRFLHISTDEVFGSLELSGPGFHETSPYEPSSPYSASKAASDHFVRAYGETFKLPILISNCSNNYGLYHFPEKLIPLMIIKALNHQPLPVYGEGLNVRDWLFVEDHARALALILTRGRIGESYNIGGEAERSNISVVHAICDILDRKKPNGNNTSRRELITYVKDRPGHDLRYAIDATKIRNELGWTPSVSFETGLERTIDWYLENQAWWQPLLDGGKYAGQRLGQA
jgi:dTDP-glucose 4,6-dehydratase